VCVPGCFAAAAFAYETKSFIWINRKTNIINSRKKVFGLAKKIRLARINNGEILHLDQWCCLGLMEYCIAWQNFVIGSTSVFR
jgi:hypothetical protein